VSTGTNEAGYLKPGLPIPVPEGDGLSAPYWEGLRQNKLRVQKCRGCGAHQWGPEWICHACHSFDLDWVEVEGKGRVYSWQRPWHPVHPALKDQGPYLVVLVELPHAGGIRMLGNLLATRGATPSSASRSRWCSSTTRTRTRPSPWRSGAPSTPEAAAR
jgi:uncharacterized OB-fold protein